MKIMTAKEAKNSFGVFLDSVQREPVVVTKRDRPVGVMFSMNDVPAMIDFAEAMKTKINTGIQAGLDDIKAGRVHEVNDEFITDLQQDLLKRINRKKTVEMLYIFNSKQDIAGFIQGL